MYVSKKIPMYYIEIHRYKIMLSTRGRGRTGTANYGHWILSPARLPIPPPGRSGVSVGVSACSILKPE